MSDSLTDGSTLLDMGDRWPKGAFSHSRFSVLRMCTHAHQLKYVQRVTRVGKRPDALAIGAGFHKGLEIVGNLALENEELATEDWEAAALQAIEGVTGPPSLEITRLLGAYRLKHGEFNAGYGSHTLVATEQVLKANELHRDIGGFAAIADALTRDLDGNLWAWEHKTAGRMPSGELPKIAEGIKSRPQMKALAYCARDVFNEPVGVVHNLITKTRTPATMRVPVTFTDRELDRWAEEQVKLEALLPLDIQNHDACDPPMGFRCQYFEHCHSEDESLKEQLFQIRLPNK